MVGLAYFSFCIFFYLFSFHQLTLPNLDMRGYCLDLFHFVLSRISKGRKGKVYPVKRGAGELLGETGKEKIVVGLHCISEESGFSF